ncbi:hypothetical protein [Streptomyces canus]|uniref:hypothetical protein n=1 Tax=Streptomyces canus TaxID=58343 RepID=UPI00324C5065
MQLLSTPRPLTRKRTVRLLAALCCAALPVLGAATRPSAASTATTEVLGNATHFAGLGSPYGGCGLPQRELDSQDFVALNVFNTPGDYSGSYPRPIPDARASIKGAFDSGRSCGRWVKVTIGDYCTGTNDGAPGPPFCRNGSWRAGTCPGGFVHETGLWSTSCDVGTVSEGSGRKWARTPCGEN